MNENIDSGFLVNTEIDEGFSVDPYNEKIYKCIRCSGQPLYATCESLIGNYFEVAE